MAGACAGDVDAESDCLRLMEKGRAVPIVEIRIADTAEGWRAVACFSFTGGTYWGQYSAVTDYDPPFTEKGQAVCYAAAKLTNRLSSAPAHTVDASMEPQRRKMLAWLAPLALQQPRRVPEQIEMFA
jgi:hypothetical protein